MCGGSDLTVRSCSRLPGSGPPARPPPGLPQARHLAVRPGTPQFSVRGCPDILAAERQARHLLRHRTIEQLIYSKIQAAAGQDDHAWKRRTLALIETNPRQVTESGAQALFQAAAYPEAIATAVAACASPQDPAQSNLH
jgi:hypothetical protein